MQLNYFWFSASGDDKANWDDTAWRENISEICLREGSPSNHLLPKRKIARSLKNISSNSFGSKEIRIVNVLTFKDDGWLPEGGEAFIEV